MTDPIISPWIFYIIGILPYMSLIFLGLGVLFIVNHLFSKSSHVLSETLFNIEEKLQEAADNIFKIKNAYYTQEVEVNVYDSKTEFPYECVNPYIDGNTIYVPKNKMDLQQLMTLIETKCNQYHKRNTNIYNSNIKKWEENINDAIQRVKLLSFTSSKKSFIMGLVFLLSYILIPSQDTAKQMLLANYITQTNIKNVTNMSKETIDYVFDKIQNIVGGKKDEKSKVH